MTYRHAVKDADNNVPFGETLPVHYNALAGLTVEEMESLQDYDAFPVVGSGVFEGVEGTGGIFCDIGPCGARAHPGNAEQKEDSADGCRTGTGEKYDGPAARGGDPCIWKTLGRRAEQLS